MIGFDDLEIAAYVTPPLTTICVPAHQIGRSAAEAITGFLERSKPLYSMEFEATLVVRRSTARPCTA